MTTIAELCRTDGFFVMTATGAELTRDWTVGGKKFAIQNDIECASLVCIDEICLRNDMSPAQREAMWLILELRKQRSMILTGNMMPDELKDWDARIGSRVCRGQVLLFTGTDYRAAQMQIEEV